MSESHWTRHAAQWNNVGSPLRPNGEDQALYWRAISTTPFALDVVTRQALLLGVTPELRELPWPQSTQLIACDLSLQMLEGVWPLAAFPGKFAGRVNANWMQLPLVQESCSLAIGDGCLTTIPDDASHRRIAVELHRVLQNGASLILRLFCAPRTPENVIDVLNDLRRGAVGGFHAYKWRLVMAMHADDPKLILADVWSRWDAEFPDKEEVSALSGWSMAAINTLEAYRGATARYSFLRIDEVAALFAPEFEVIEILQPEYELGGRCPVVHFRRRQ